MDPIFSKTLETIIRKNTGEEQDIEIIDHHNDQLCITVSYKYRDVIDSETVVVPVFITDLLQYLIEKLTN